MEVVDLIAVAVRSWCAMRSGGGRYGVGGWGMGMGWDCYPDLHTQSLIQTCWSTTCITLIKTQAEGGGRERKDAFAGVADLEKGVRS